jgi:hypothetical protein
VAGSCEHGNGPLDSIKGKKFFDHLSGLQAVKMDCSVKLVICVVLQIS